jgi:hypothetical protein
MVDEPEVDGVVPAVEEKVDEKVEEKKVDEPAVESGKTI